MALGPAMVAEAGTLQRWSDPRTWGGRVPGRRDVVRVSKKILLDVNARVAGVIITGSGALVFASKRSVTLTSSGNVVVKGKLVMRPRYRRVIHKLRFVGVKESRFRGGHTMDPLPSDVGLWVMDTGRLDAAGSPKLAWTRLTESVPAAATAITLAEDPVGWRVGDFLTITPTQPPTVETFWYAFDTVQIAGISGRTIQLSRATTYDHPAVTVAPGRTYGAEVLNLTRNVRVEGTRKGRAHILVLANQPQEISHVAIRYMGPRKTKRDGTSVPVLGRYPLHFHMQGGLARGTTVTGVVVRDSRNHAFVAHTSNGITYRECIAYRIVEDAYWWDEGEVTSDLLWERCVAANVRKLDGDGDTRCTGFNMGMGKRNAAVGCVAVGLHQKTQASGFKWRRAGVWRFEDCLAHNNAIFGIFAWTNDDPNAHRISRFVGYHNGTGIFHGAYSNSYLYEDGVLCGNRSAIVISALAHEPGLRFERMRCDGAGISDYLIRTEEHKSSAHMPTVISACDFRGYNKAAIGWLAVDPDNPEQFEVLDCSFEGNEFWLASNIHPQSLILVRDPIHGAISLHRVDLEGDLLPEWNARVNPVA
ncbi:MAG: G8 domain-containing protein [Actinomycetota bacterium]